MNVSGKSAKRYWQKVERIFKYDGSVHIAVNEISAIWLLSSNSVPPHVLGGGVPYSFMEGYKLVKSS